MKKNYVFYIDDNIWVFKDLAREKPASIFDNPYLGFLKYMHDTYGTKTLLNVFFRLDEANTTRSSAPYEYFDLTMMPDIWKSEWQANADWLRLAFHSRSEFPMWPYVNATYDEFKAEYEECNREIVRFAGAEVLSKDMVIHWIPISKGACQVLAEDGVKVLSGSYGIDAPPEDEALLPPEDLECLNRNRTEETSRMIWKPYAHIPPVAALRGYNHMPQEDADYLCNRSEVYKMPDIPLYLKRYANIVLNMIKLEQVEPLLEPMLDTSYVGLCMHEAYYYPHFYLYLPDYCKLIETAVQILTEHGFRSIFPSEMLEA